MLRPCHHVNQYYIKVLFVIPDYWIESNLLKRPSRRGGCDLLRVGCTVPEGAECSDTEEVRCSIGCRISYSRYSSSCEMTEGQQKRICQVFVIADLFLSRVEQLASSEIKRESFVLFNPQQSGIAEEK